jgi:hypothetical protein
LKGVDRFNALQQVSTLRFNAFQRRFGGAKGYKDLTRQELGITRPLLVNGFQSSSRNVFVMDSETENSRSGKRGGGRAYRSRLEPFVDFIRAQPEVVPPAHPNVPAIRPESNRPMLAAVPVIRPFRRPNPNNIKLNDPTEV